MHYTMGSPKSQVPDIIYFIALHPEYAHCLTSGHEIVVNL